MALAESTQNLTLPGQTTRDVSKVRVKSKADGKVVKNKHRKQKSLNNNVMTKDVNIGSSVGSPVDSPSQPQLPHFAAFCNGSKADALTHLPQLNGTADKLGQRLTDVLSKQIGPLKTGVSQVDQGAVSAVHSPRHSSPAQSGFLLSLPSSQEIISGSSPLKSKSLSCESLATVAASEETGDDVDSPATQPVPYGWKRVIDGDSVHYISPSEVVLDSMTAVRAHLLSPYTCKCGLQCPVSLAQTFNFDPAVMSLEKSPQEILETERLTNLCSHKWKLYSTLSEKYHSPVVRSPASNPPENGVCKPSPQTADSAAKTASLPRSTEESGSLSTEADTPVQPSPPPSTQSVFGSPQQQAATSTSQPHVSAAESLAAATSQSQQLLFGEDCDLALDDVTSAISRVEGRDVSELSSTQEAAALPPPAQYGAPPPAAVGYVAPPPPHQMQYYSGAIMSPQQAAPAGYHYPGQPPHMSPQHLPPQSQFSPQSHISPQPLHSPVYTPAQVTQTSPHMPQYLPPQMMYVPAPPHHHPHHPGAPPPGPQPQGYMPADMHYRVPHMMTVMPPQQHMIAGPMMPPAHMMPVARAAGSEVGASVPPSPSSDQMSPVKPKKKAKKRKTSSTKAKPTEDEEIGDRQAKTPSTGRTIQSPPLNSPSLQQPSPLLSSPAPDRSISPLTDHSIPQATGIPQAGSIPQATGIPQAGSIPQATGIPQAGSIPQATGIPQAGSIPQATGIPKATGLPQATGIPQASGIPQATGMPQSQSTPHHVIQPATQTISQPVTQSATIPSSGTVGGTTTPPATVYQPMSHPSPRPPSQSSNASVQSDGNPAAKRRKIDSASPEQSVSPQISATSVSTDVPSLAESPAGGTAAPSGCVPTTGAPPAVVGAPTGSIASATPGVPSAVGYAAPGGISVHPPGVMVHPGVRPQMPGVRPMGVRPPQISGGSPAAIPTSIPVSTTQISTAAGQTAGTTVVQSSTGASNPAAAATVARSSVLVAQLTANTTPTSAPVSQAPPVSLASNFQPTESITQPNGALQSTQANVAQAVNVAQSVPNVAQSVSHPMAQPVGGAVQTALVYSGTPPVGYQRLPPPEGGILQQQLEAGQLPPQRLMRAPSPYMHMWQRPRFYGQPPMVLQYPPNQALRPVMEPYALQQEVVGTEQTDGGAPVSPACSSTPSLSTSVSSVTTTTAYSAPLVFSSPTKPPQAKPKKKKKPKVRPGTVPGAVTSVDGNTTSGYLGVNPQAIALVQDYQQSRSPRPAVCTASVAVTTASPPAQPAPQLPTPITQLPTPVPTHVPQQTQPAPQVLSHVPQSSPLPLPPQQPSPVRPQTQVFVSTPSIVHKPETSPVVTPTSVASPASKPSTPVNMSKVKKTIAKSSPVKAVQSSEPEITKERINQIIQEVKEAKNHEEQMLSSSNTTATGSKRSRVRNKSAAPSSTSPLIRPPLIQRPLNTAANRRLPTHPALSGAHSQPHSPALPPHSPVPHSPVIQASHSPVVAPSHSPVVPPSHSPVIAPNHSPVIAAHSPRNIHLPVRLHEALPLAEAIRHESDQPLAEPSFDPTDSVKSAALEASGNALLPPPEALGDDDTVINVNELLLPIVSSACSSTS